MYAVPQHIISKRKIVNFSKDNYIINIIFVISRKLGHFILGVLDYVLTLKNSHNVLIVSMLFCKSLVLLLR